MDYVNLFDAGILGNCERATMASNGGVVRKKFNKVVLAYSGGLDTSVIVPWLRLGVSLFSSLFSLTLNQY